MQSGILTDRVHKVIAYMPLLQVEIPDEVSNFETKLTYPEFQLATETKVVSPVCSDIKAITFCTILTLAFLKDAHRRKKLTTDFSNFLSKLVWL